MNEHERREEGGGVDGPWWKIETRVRCIARRSFKPPLLCVGPSNSSLSKWSTWKTCRAETSGVIQRDTGRKNELNLLRCLTASS